MAPLRNAFAGASGGAIGACGVVAAVGSCTVSGPIGWMVGIAGVLGALYGVSCALSAHDATLNQAFQDGLLSGLRVGSAVLRVHRETVVRDSLCSDSPGSNRTAREVITDSDGQRVSPDNATFDFNLSTRASGSGSSFRLASGVAATCDECGKILSVGNGWYHLSNIEKDLCAAHVAKLPVAERASYCCVDAEDALGANRGKYMLNDRVPVDVFPQHGPQADGKVVLEVSHLVNPKGDETLASMLKPLMPQVKIEEYRGPRHFCRIMIGMRDEPAARALIKSLGKQRNKKVSIKEISREFDSPRY